MEKAIADSDVLAGKTIVVTRPAAQAGALAAGIRAHGGLPFLFPLLEIHALEDAAPLAAIAATLADFAIAVFISVNAARHALPHLPARAWPAGTRALAVGSGTARALAEAGIAAATPQQGFDSEGLLTLPCLAPQEIAGKRVLLFRGNGGRELLQETLTRRGAQVTSAVCYRRGPPTTGVDAFLQQVRAGALSALILSSSEALGHLLALDDARPFQTEIRALPLFTPHPRIAAKAEAAGFQQVIRTAPLDEGVLAGLCAYNWPLCRKCRNPRL
ncbi:MAG: uroporphyrinogen-III synthase [Zoogloeaceae bacterium]|jgi:uroporphyrinogen-III synthase|nr:uroporphyrinogen-III synthase [Zoogloeaceae bacterium]